MFRARSLRGVAWIAPAAAFVVFLRTVGVPWSDAGVYSGYFALYILAPGVLYLRLIRPAVLSPPAVLAYGAVFGLAAESVLYLLFLVFGIQELFAWSIAIPIAVLLVVRRRRRARLGWRLAASSWSLLLVALLVLLTLSLGTLAVFVIPTNNHHVVQAEIATSALLDWPLPQLSVVDTTLAYNWLAHLDIAATHVVTGIPVIVLASRIIPALHYALLLLTIIGFCRRQFADRGFIALMVIVQVLWVVGWGSPLATQIFGGAIPGAMNLVISTTFGFSVFFVFIDTTLAFARGSPTPRRLGGALLVLGFVAAGVRSALSPILLGGLGFLLVVRWMMGRTMSSRYLVALFSVLSTFILGLFLFYRVHSDVEAVSFLKVTWNPVQFFLDNDRLFIATRELIALGARPALAALAAFGVMMVFHAGFLTTGLFHRLKSAVGEPLSDVELWLLGTALAGIAAVFVTEAPGGSHFTFLHYAHFAMAILGAIGLRALLRHVRHPSSRTLGVVVLVSLSGLWLAAHLVEQGLEVRHHSDELSQRTAYPDMWAVPRPSNSLEWLQQHRTDDQVLEIVSSDFEALARPVIVESGGVQLLQNPHWVAPEALSEARTEAHSGLVNAAAQGVLDTGILSEIADSLDDQKTLFVLATNAARPDRPDRVAVVATDADLTLYRLVDP